MTVIAYHDLVEFVRQALDVAGLDDFSANAVTTGLCETSLRGVDSHGVRLLAHYVDSALNGRKNPRPDFRFEATFPALGVLHADDAFGHAAGMKAIDHAMSMADVSGIGAVVVRDSSHPGAMASFALKAARRGFLAMAFTHADSLLLSPGGTRPFFGTNPICMAAPRREDEPYCLDMATSVIPWNRLRMHRESGEALPAGVAADDRGRPAEAPDRASCLMPVGSPVAGYKGYGLASMVEVLCGVLSGMAFGRDIPAMYTAPMDAPRRLGQFYLVMRVDGAIGADAFRAHMQTMTDRVRAEPAEGGTTVMMPGDPQRLAAESRRASGIPVDEATASSFTDLATRLGIDGPRLMTTAPA